MKTDFSQREQIEKALRDDRYDAKSRDKVEQMMRGGAFDHKTKEVDSKKTEAINRYVDTKVQQALRNGTLKPAQRDGFMRKIMGR